MQTQYTLYHPIDYNILRQEMEQVANVRNKHSNNIRLSRVRLHCHTRQQQIPFH